ncbi:hypothetical protein [Bradyrhizobium sp. URHD0069]|uniref:hypothetical protein n=1 Tax=Bradyrhizobium sp. URHD0069 TaxID=1380355 RepID=UPI0012DCE797|nr:hypothetical protein [Bradyrhizobium sp. URHD0069]
MDLIQVVLKCRLGHELPYALVQSASSNKVGSGAPRFFDALSIEGGPFPENRGSIEIYLNVGVIHLYRFAFFFLGNLLRCPLPTALRPADDWVFFADFFDDFFWLFSWLSFFAFAAFATVFAAFLKGLGSRLATAFFDATIAHFCLRWRWYLSSEIRTNSGGILKECLRVFMISKWRRPVWPVAVEVSNTIQSLSAQ